MWDRLNMNYKKKFWECWEIKNEKNNLKILLENEDVILISEKNIDLNDNELNEFLCSYKKVIEDKKIQIVLCENIKSYEY